MMTCLLRGVVACWEVAEAEASIAAWQAATAAAVLTAEQRLVVGTAGLQGCGWQSTTSADAVHGVRDGVGIDDEPGNTPCRLTPLSTHGGASIADSGGRQLRSCSVQQTAATHRAHLPEAATATACSDDGTDAAVATAATSCH